MSGRRAGPRPGWAPPDVRPWDVAAGAAIMAALAVVAFLWLTLDRKSYDDNTPRPPIRTLNPAGWPTVHRTYLTTGGYDAFMTTAVVQPEDLDR